MKKTTLSLFTAATLFSGAALASIATTSSDSSSIYKKLKDSPLSLTAIVELATENRTSNHKINTLENTNYVYLGYKFSPKDSLSLETRFNTVKAESAEAKSTWLREVIKYSRSGILNQKDHGVDLSASIEERYLPDAQSRAARGSYGLTRATVTGSQTFSNAISHRVSAYFAVNNNREHVSKNYTSYVYLLGVQTYSFSDKFSASMAQEIFRSYGKDYNTYFGDKELATRNTGEVFDLSFSFGYQVNKQVRLGLGLSGMTVMKANDGEFVNKKFLKEMNYSINARVSAF